MTLKAYKYRAYPTEHQARYFNEVFGSCRFVWNELARAFNRHCKDGPNKPIDLKILKEDPDNDWLHKSISYALQQKQIDFEETKSQFFDKKRKVRLGGINFKKKGVSRDSFRIPGQAIGYSSGIDFDNGTIKVPKSGKLKIIVDRKFTGELRSITVSRNKCGQYFVSVLVKEEIQLKPSTGRSIGIDLGLKEFATLSNGLKIENPRWFRESQAELKKAQQHLSRKQKGSKRRNKQKLKVARIHQKISNQRSFFQHNISTWLINNFDIIITEDLNIKGMLKNRCLAKSISDASWSSFISMLSYKSDWYGKTFHKIDRFYPSSKLCSNCNSKLDKMDLSIREWTCTTCNTEHDRDTNAAKNIIYKGLTDLYSFTSAESVDYKRREAATVEGLIPLPKAASLKRLVTQF